MAFPHLRRIFLLAHDVQRAAARRHHGHAVGGALIALLLGPEAAAIAVSVALALQALLFGDGGILSFGANCFNMAFVLPFAAGANVFRALNRPSARQELGHLGFGHRKRLGRLRPGGPVRGNRVWYSADALYQRFGRAAVLPLPRCLLPFLP